MIPHFFIKYNVKRTIHREYFTDSLFQKPALYIFSISLDQPPAISLHKRLLEAQPQSFLQTGHEIHFLVFQFELEPLKAFLQVNQGLLRIIAFEDCRHYLFSEGLDHWICEIFHQALPVLLF